MSLAAEGKLYGRAWYTCHNGLCLTPFTLARYSRGRYQKNPRRALPSALASGTTVTVHDLSTKLTPYEEAWSLQKRLLKAVLSSEEGSRPAGGYLLLIQHPAVYTLGSGSSLDHLGFSPSNPPFPLFRTERGGEVTYHGPGQLVAYPILNLRCFNQDLHWYLRSLEEVIIRCLDEVSGLKGKRIPGLTGVWVDGRKVAAIGVRAQRWVTYHGLAVNIANDLRPFQLITPCGIKGHAVTSVKDLLRPDSTVSCLSPDVTLPLNLRPLGSRDAALVSEYACAMKWAFGEVFSAELCELKRDDMIFKHNSLRQFESGGQVTILRLLKDKPV